MLRRHSFTFAAAVCAALLLSGCTAPATHASSSPSPKSSPLFRTDAQALAAAKKAYAKYLDVSNQIGQSGWVDASDYGSVESGPALASDQKTADQLSAKGLRLIGSYDIDSIRLESRTSSVVTVYACLDVSAADVVDSTGTSVVASNRKLLAPLELQFKAKADSSLLLASSVAWDGDDFC